MANKLDKTYENFEAITQYRMKTYPDTSKDRNKIANLYVLYGKRKLLGCCTHNETRINAVKRLAWQIVFNFGNMPNYTKVQIITELRGKIRTIDYTFINHSNNYKHEHN